MWSNGISGLFSALAAFILPLAVLAAPTITSFTPTIGGPGVNVTINGAGFDNASGVFFDNVQALYTVVSSTKITATVPLNGTTGKLTVFGPAGSVNSATEFIVKPRIDDFAPSSATPGQLVTIFGLNFRDATNVSFNGISAAFSPTASTQISVQVPPNAVSGPLSVSSIAGTGYSTNVFVLAGSGPIIGNFDPGIARTGEVVTLIGGNFTGTTAVKFNGTTATYSVTADTQIRTAVPAGATTGPISVITPKGTNVSSQLFTVLTAGPVVTGFDPINGLPGNLIKINGLNFANTMRVLFNGADSLYFGVSSDTQIQAIVPTNATSGPITVITLTGTNSSSTGFTILPPGPQILGFSPSNGIAGTQVLISGTGFTNITAVLFGSTNAFSKSFGASSATQIQAIVPTNAVTGPITVSTLSGTNSSAQSFRILPPGPIITGFSPTNGSPGDQISIEGHYLTFATNVQFNGASTAQFGVTSDTQIRATVPTNATSGPITVITPTGTNVSLIPFDVSPSIFGFSPTSGTAGAHVTVTGLNFSGVTSVKIGSLSASVVSKTLTNLIFAVPTNAVSDTINLASPAGIVATTNLFHVLPKIDKFAPLAGPPGTAIQIDGSGFAGASSVVFGGIASTSFTLLSVNRISTAVPSLGKTGQISVVTPEGTALSTGTFTVAISGDLGISVTPFPTSMIAFDFVTNVAVVTNAGPSLLGGVSVLGQFSVPITVASLKTTNGTSSSGSNFVSFSIASLPAGGSATLITVFRPLQAGSLTNKLSVTNANFDPVLANNSVEISAIVKPYPLPSLHIAFSGTNQIAITWPAAFTNFYLQGAGAIPLVWTNISSGPILFEDQFWVTLRRSANQQFYRLRSDL